MDYNTQYPAPILTVQCICRNLSELRTRKTEPWLNLVWDFISTFIELHGHLDGRFPPEVTSNTSFPLCRCCAKCGSDSNSHRNRLAWSWWTWCRFVRAYSLKAERSVPALLSRGILFRLLQNSMPTITILMLIRWYAWDNKDDRSQNCRIRLSDH